MNWLRKMSRKDGFLIAVYGVAFFLLLVVASITAYVLFHPELGLTERNPIVVGFVFRYGLPLGLLLVFLHNAAGIILPWSVFAPYLLLRRKYRWDNIHADAVMYSFMTAYGLYTLVSLLLNAVNDVSWLVFNASPHMIVAVWRFWDDAICLIPAIFAGLLPRVYYLMRKAKSEPE